MERSDLPRSKLTLWALTVVAITVKHADHAPVVPNSRLRLALAWLSVAHGETTACELFWQDARNVMPDQRTDYMKAYSRSSNLRLRLEGLCERLGCAYPALREYADGINAEWP